MKQNEFKDLNVYLKAINLVDTRLSKEEERMHIIQSQEGDSRSLNLIISSNIKYIVTIAKRHTGCGVPLVDLVQEGVMFLMKAIEKYDTQAQNNLRSYASRYIQKGITDCIANTGRTVRLPMHKEFERYLANKNGEEVANIREVRIDNKINEESASTFADLLIKVDPAVETSESQNTAKETVNILLNKLDKREREVIKAYFGIDREYPLPGNRVAEEFELSQVRVSQIVKSSIKLMQEA